MDTSFATDLPPGIRPSLPVHLATASAHAQVHAHMPIGAGAGSAHHARDTVNRTQLRTCGRSVLMRPAQPHDVLQASEFLRALSLRSQRRRFYGRLPALGLAALQSAQSLADPRQGVLVAVMQKEGHRDGCEQLLADARFVCDAGGREAEFAIVVSDLVHRQGLGRAMLLALQQQAAERGVRWLRGEVQVDNPAMLCLLLSLGFKPALCDEAAGLMVFEQRLSSANVYAD